MITSGIASFMTLLMETLKLNLILQIKLTLPPWHIISCSSARDTALATSMEDKTVLTNLKEV